MYEDGRPPLTGRYVGQAVFGRGEGGRTDGLTDRANERRRRQTAQRRVKISAIRFVSEALVGIISIPCLHCG